MFESHELKRMHDILHGNYNLLIFLQLVKIIL